MPRGRNSSSATQGRAAATGSPTLRASTRPTAATTSATSESETTSDVEDLRLRHRALNGSRRLAGGLAAAVGKKDAGDMDRRNRSRSSSSSSNGSDDDMEEDGGDDEDDGDEDNDKRLGSKQRQAAHKHQMTGRRRVETSYRNRGLGGARLGGVRGQPSSTEVDDDNAGDANDDTDDPGDEEDEDEAQDGEENDDDENIDDDDGDDDDEAMEESGDIDIEPAVLAGAEEDGDAENGGNQAQGEQQKEGDRNDPLVLLKDQVIFDELFEKFRMANDISSTPPVILGKEINLFLMFRAVLLRGGTKPVPLSNPAWRQVFLECTDATGYSSNTGYYTRLAYEKYLTPFEDECNALKSALKSVEGEIPILRVLKRSSKVSTNYQPTSASGTSGPPTTAGRGRPRGRGRGRGRGGWRGGWRGGRGGRGGGANAAGSRRSLLSGHGSGSDADDGDSDAERRSGGMWRLGRRDAQRGNADDADDETDSETSDEGANGAVGVPDDVWLETSKLLLSGQSVALRTDEDGDSAMLVAPGFSNDQERDEWFAVCERHMKQLRDHYVRLRRKLRRVDRALGFKTHLKKRMIDTLRQGDGSDAVAVPQFSALPEKELPASPPPINIMSGAIDEGQNEMDVPADEKDLYTTSLSRKSDSGSPPSPPEESPTPPDDTTPKGAVDTEEEKSESPPAGKMLMRRSSRSLATTETALEGESVNGSEDPKTEDSDDSPGQRKRRRRTRI